jgi:tripartite-type tricarboxylate transporter receptor subunit TctC
MRRVALWIAAAMAALLEPGVPAWAQDFPQHPIRLVVGYGPGSGADTIARIVAERLSEQLKTAVIVENREGAGSAIGTAYVAKAAADGYTLLLGASTMTVSPHMQESPLFDPVKDFVPIVKVAEISLLMIAQPDAPYKNLKDLVAYAKTHPGQLSYATSGKGSPSHLSVELIRQATNIDVHDIPYKNVGQAMTDTLSGQVSFYFPGFSAAFPQVKAGKARALAVGSLSRSAQLPDVGTESEELGINGLEVLTWYGLLAPANTPKPVIDRLYAEAKKVMELSDVRSRIEKAGAQVVISPPGEFAATISSDNAKYGALIKRLGLKE